MLYLFRGCVLSLRLTPSFPLRGLSLSLCFITAFPHLRGQRMQQGTGKLRNHCLGLEWYQGTALMRLDPI